jgi:hypothetical protein
MAWHLLCNGKVKLSVPLYSVKACRGRRVIHALSLNHGTRWRRVEKTKISSFLLRVTVLTELYRLFTDVLIVR